MGTRTAAKCRRSTTLKACADRYGMRAPAHKLSKRNHLTRGTLAGPRLGVRSGHLHHVSGKTGIVPNAHYEARVTGKPEVIDRRSSFHAPCAPPSSSRLRFYLSLVRRAEAHEARSGPGRHLRSPEAWRSPCCQTCWRSRARSVLPPPKKMSDARWADMGLGGSSPAHANPERITCARLLEHFGCGRQVRRRMHLRPALRGS